MYPGANNHILFIFWNAEVGLFSIIYTANKGYVIKAAKAIYHHLWLTKFAAYHVLNIQLYS